MNKYTLYVRMEDVTNFFLIADVTEPRKENYTYLLYIVSGLIRVTEYKVDLNRNSQQ